jgi:hypothetical protein
VGRAGVTCGAAQSPGGTPARGQSFAREIVQPECRQRPMTHPFRRSRPLAGVIAAVMLIASSVALAQTGGSGAASGAGGVGAGGGTGGAIGGPGAASGAHGVPRGTGATATQTPGRSTGLPSTLPPPVAGGSSGRPSTTGRANTPGNSQGQRALPGCPPGSAASGTPRIINDPALGAGQDAPGC